jgi:dTDP-4-amino-4,6-dideoxygalactose transaminase
LIPHYHPPFGIARAVGAMLAPWPAPGIAALERGYAEHCGVADAVVVPAVRSAILLLLRAALPAGGLAIGPAFTCLVVHEAMLASGMRTKFLEPEPKRFTPTATAIRAAAEPGCALVLSELYGIELDENFLRSLDDLSPALRILDSAMGIPRAERLREMRPTDVALVSFGMGKSQCAGGGGVALFADSALAARVRGARDAMLAESAAPSLLKSDLKFLAGLALRSRALVKHARMLRANIAPVPAPLASGTPGAASAPGAQRTWLSPEWTYQLSRAQRRLVARNLANAVRSAKLRREQAQVYLRCLAPLRITPGVDERSLPQSHFPIRVPAESRAALRASLRAQGFETGDEFPISGALRERDYPLALVTSQEIVTLPLGEHVSTREIERLCGIIAAALRQIPMKVGSGSAQTAL